jgi:hypothetical protein
MSPIAQQHRSSLLLRARTLEGRKSSRRIDADQSDPNVLSLTMSNSPACTRTHSTTRFRDALRARALLLHFRLGRGLGGTSPSRGEVERR